MRFISDILHKPQKEKLSDECELPLSDHPLYKTMDTYRKFKITCLCISNPIKKRMAICYLTIMYNNLSGFLITLSDENRMDLYINDLNLISDGMVSSMNKTEEECLSEGIPQLFLDKMKEFNYRYFDLIMTTLTDIHHSSYYPNNKCVMTSVLDMMLLYVRMMMSNTEVTINNMNGELQAALKGSVFDI